MRRGPLRRDPAWHASWASRLGAGIIVGAVAFYGVVDPWTTPYMASEARRLGGIDHEWVPLGQIAPVMARAVVAAEDADFCQHWGIDMTAVRAAIADGGTRGGSTISQQVVKNVYLWQGRSWPRKALEAAITPLVEAFWSKERILEVYLNSVEFGEGVFGVDAAAHRYFRTEPAALSDVQAARLSAVLPDPKHRSAEAPGDSLRRRADRIRDGAATIRADGRAACFQQ